MNLTCYTRREGRRHGGVNSVALLPVTGIKDIAFDPDNGHCISLELADGYRFSYYIFREDGALYTESVQCEGMQILVRHRLEMTLERMDEASQRAVIELAGIDCPGVAAIIRTASGERFIAGVSERIGTRYPLVLSVSESTTGNKLEDIKGEKLILVSCDISKAAVFKADIEY